MICFLKPAAPLYSTLASLQVVLDATGLRGSTDNSYGVLAGHTVQVWKSITPGSTSLTWAADVVGTPGTKSLLKFQDGYIEFPGQTTLISQNSVNDFETLSYASPVTNLKYTIHIVLKIAQEDVPNFSYGLFGTSGSSAGNKGTCTFYTDNIISSRSDGLVSTISKGSAGFIIGNLPDNLITANVPFVYTEETDMSQAAADRRKHYINGTLFAYTGISASTAVASVPTYLLEIGGCGNNVVPFRGWISHFIWQNAIESSGTRTAFIASLLPYKNKLNSNYFYDTDEAKTYAIYNTLATTGRYYFVQGLIKNPSDSNHFLEIHCEGDGHLIDVNKNIKYRSSTDQGRTWSAESTAYDPDAGGDFGTVDSEWGWSSDGRVNGLVDYQSVAVPGTYKLAFIQSTNALSSTTVTDITSQIPSDGLADFRAHGNIIEVNGYLFATFYKINSGATSSANYLMRKPIGSSTTWTFFNLRGPASTYINEMSLIDLDDNNILVIARDEATGEFYQWRVADITGTPSVVTDGDLSLGETLTVPAPPQLAKFTMVGQRVIAIYHIRKEAADRRILVTYGTAANLLANGLTGWDTDTKFTVGTDSQYLHYGRMLHYDDNMNAIGSYSRDPGTLTENTLVTFTVPATQYYLTKQELGL